MTLSSLALPSAILVFISMVEQTENSFAIFNTGNQQHQWNIGYNQVKVCSCQIEIQRLSK